MALIKGIIATPLPPFDEKGKLDTGPVDDYVHWLAVNGVRGIFCLGTWGGFPLLTKAERLTLAEAYAKSAKKKGLQCILQVGNPCLPDAMDNCDQANDLGVDAVASLVPFYYSGAQYFDLDDYRAYFAALMARSDRCIFIKIPKPPAFFYRRETL